MIHTIRDSLWPELGPELKRHPYIIEVTRGKDVYVEKIEGMTKPE